jgi:hypothetical protein
MGCLEARDPFISEVKFCIVRGVLIVLFKDCGMPLIYIKSLIK